MIILYTLVKCMKRNLRKCYNLYSFKFIEYDVAKVHDKSSISGWISRNKVSWLFITVAACCSNNNGQLNVEPQNLTHSYLLKQACNLTVNSATQLLTLTVAAILDANTNYRASLTKLIGLIENSLENTDMPSYQDQIWDEVIKARAEMDLQKKTLLELMSYMEYVEKTATSAAETAFLGGAEYASTAMCERINSAQQQVYTDQEKTRILEGELLKIQQSHVYLTTKKTKTTKSHKA